MRSEVPDTGLQRQPYPSGLVSQHGVNAWSWNPQLNIWQPQPTHPTATQHFFPTSEPNFNLPRLGPYPRTYQEAGPGATRQGYFAPWRHGPREYMPGITVQQNDRHPSAERRFFNPDVGTRQWRLPQAAYAGSTVPNRVEHLSGPPLLPREISVPNQSQKHSQPKAPVGTADLPSSKQTAKERRRSSARRKATSKTVSGAKSILDTNAASRFQSEAYPETEHEAKSRRHSTSKSRPSQARSRAKLGAKSGATASVCRTSKTRTSCVITPKRGEKSRKDLSTLSTSSSLILLRTEDLPRPSADGKGSARRLLIAVGTAALLYALVTTSAVFVKSMRDGVRANTTTESSHTNMSSSFTGSSTANSTVNISLEFSFRSDGLQTQAYAESIINVQATM